MSADPAIEADAIAGVALPREQHDLVGHAEAERALLEAYRSGRMPHGWLFLGPQGIGKATLAFRLARFVLANADPSRPEVAEATSLRVDPTHPVARRIAAGAHPDFVHLRRPLDEKTGRLRTELVVDEIRRGVHFFAGTAVSGGWRVAIVDAADDMNASAANALLKVLEEPPPRAILVIVAHRPGAVLPTIRSRCRVLALGPLSRDAVRRGLDLTAPRAHEPAELEAAADAADGSLRRALVLLAGEGLAVRRRFEEIAAALPRLDRVAAHHFADTLAGRGRDEAWAAFQEDALALAHRRMRAAVVNPAAAAAWADAADALAVRFRDTDVYNLDRKSAVLAALRLLAEAAADPLSGSAGWAEARADQR